MIQLEHISKSFAGKSGAVDALKDVTIRVEKGDIYGIIGFSGAGKSTLIRMVNRLERPDTGAVRVDGQELSKLSTAQLRKLRRSIGFVRTVINDQIPASILGLLKNEQRYYRMERLKFVGSSVKKPVISNT